MHRSQKHMLLSLSNPVGTGGPLRAAGRALSAAFLAAILGAVPAAAIRQESKAPAIQGKSNPYRNGFKHLRPLQASDLSGSGERLRQGRLALGVDAAADILKRMNARLRSSGGEVRIHGIETDEQGNRHIRIDLFQ